MSDVAGCRVSPNPISLGGQTNLYVDLTAPAPPGGEWVAINAYTDGSIETIAQFPTGLDIAQGQRTGSIPMQTTQADPAATYITFTATLGATSKTARLDFS